MLVECVVYLAVFVILLGVAMGAFYFCWDDSKALMRTTDDITAALRAGELWRADVHNASGVISVETTASGEVVKIPEGKKEILYKLDGGEVRRQASSDGPGQLLLPAVKSSEMKKDSRGSVTAWRWELALAQRTKGDHLPLLFTFEAAQKAP
jgi:hypothetical protein